MKIFLVTLMAISLNASVDLGTDGFTYEIKEKSFLKDIEEAILEMEEIDYESAIKRDVIRHATGDDNLSSCSESKRWKEFDYTTLPENVYSPSGKLYKKKGTKIASYIHQPLSLCFVDGSSLEKLKKQIDFFEAASESQCIYMVTKANVMDIRKHFPSNERIYPSKSIYEERFNVKCAPTMIYLIHNDRTTIQLGEDSL